MENIDELWSEPEKQMAKSMSSVGLIGSKESIRKQLISFQEKYNADEIMAVSYIYDPEKQKRSYQLLKEVVDEK